MRQHFQTIECLSVLLLLAISFQLVASPSWAESSEKSIAGMTTDLALKAGERMYREGILPSGEPMEALVQGDIPMDGTMFSCENCHLRSGLGSLEGDMVVYPTNAAKIFAPLHRGAEISITPARENLSAPFQGETVRPAYTDESLAEVIWAGINPDGKELSETMPRYPMDNKDMDVLIHYLKSLSAEFSPGVTENSIHLATVTTEHIDEKDRSALMDTLRAYLQDKNSQNRHQTKRATRGPWYMQEHFSSYRELILTEWKLTGPAETWSAQLEDYNKNNPAFALVGGLAPGDWAPIHQFCEKNGIPNIFPLTEHPVISKDDWYTLYFSKGPFQEGETVARYLRGTGKKTAPQMTVQIFNNTPIAKAQAEGFREMQKILRQPAAAEIILEENYSADNAYIEGLLQTYPEATFVLWLNAKQLNIINALASAESPSTVFTSAKQLGAGINDIAASARDKLFLTHPERLPAERQKLERVVTLWLKTHRLPVTNLDIQSKAYFIGWMLSGVVRMMNNEYYRDYFLDVMDMMNDEYFAIINYPRVSFGQGQRYSVKGCYIVQLGEGIPPTLIKRSDWVVQ